MSVIVSDMVITIGGIDPHMKVLSRDVVNVR
jgi:hypothetical protein